MIQISMTVKTEKLMKKVLLIDDDKICNFLCVKMLELTGFSENVRTALNGSEALVMLNDYNPDIILLDLDMPIMNGFGFLAAFEELVYPEKEKVKIIILTSSNNPNDIAKAKKLGINHY